MISDRPSTNPVQDCFRLLQKVLLEAFQTNSTLYHSLDDCTNESDFNIRFLVLKNLLQNAEHILPSDNHTGHQFFLIQSQLGISHIIICLTLQTQTNFISIGPFRSADFSNEIFLQLTKEWALTAETSSAMQQYFEQLTFVPSQSLIGVTQTILSEYFPEFKTLTPVYIDATKQLKFSPMNTETIQKLSSDHAEQYQKALLHFGEYITKGDLSHSLESLNRFLHVIRFFQNNDLPMDRKQLHLINDYCQVTFLGTIIHPVHTLKLYESLHIQIDTTTNHDALLALPNTLCHKYCLLVKNYAFPEYSQTIRNVVNYIHLHIEDDLTLSLLANHFHKNPTSLSSAFTKEVGVNITSYIHQVRIHEAIRHFNTTKLSISEVALIVGFQDFAYFSRIFHKYVGCSPREYCKRIHR